MQGGTMPAFKAIKHKSCPCDCGQPCIPYYKEGRFRDYSHLAPTCTNKASRNQQRITRMKATFAKQGQPNAKPVGSRRLHNTGNGIHIYWLIKIAPRGKW